MHKKLYLLLFFVLAGHLARAQTFGPFVITATTSPCASVDVGTGNSTVGITVKGTFSMTLQPSVSNAGQSADNIQVTPSTSSTAQSTITAAGSYKPVGGVAGYSLFQICPTAVVSGTATIYLKLSNGPIATLPTPAGGSGTVTSVTFTGDGIVDSATPSTAVTTSGTVTASPLTQAANTFLAGPTSGGAVNPTFRALVVGDLPTAIPIGSVGSAGLSGTAPVAIASTGAISLSGAAGQIPNGTTGAFTATPSLGTPNSVAGTLGLANSAAAFSTTLSSAATANSTVSFFATAPATGDLIECVTASVTCTLTDAGFLASNVVRKDAANTGTSSMTLDLSANTTTTGFKVPTTTSNTAGAASVIDYDSTNGAFHMGVNGADSLAVNETAGIAANTILKSANNTRGTVSASSMADSGSVVSSTETLKFGTAGGNAAYDDLTAGVLTADMTNQTTATCTNVTSMTWTISASKNYILRCNIIRTLAATATLQYCIGGPGTATSYSLDVQGANGTAGVWADANTLAQTAYGTKTTASAAAANTATDVVYATIQNGSTASGTALTLQTSANGTNAITVKANSACTLTQTN